MRSIFLLAFSLLAVSVLAQQRQWQGKPGGGSSLKGKISGTLTDSQSGEPLPFVSVVLKEAKSQKDVSGTITEEDGAFKITNVTLGKYQLITSFVGYETTKQEVTLTPKKPDVNLGKLVLASTTTELDEVVVEGEKELVENKIDKIVYNAERDVANIGGDASDVLRRTPLLSVDLEGNVSLRGSQNLQILINGKPSTMFGSSPADAFKAIPADNIKSVEVITTPSAKYDGEGTAGIINIITKKKNVEGFAGNVNLSLGTRQNSGVVGINAGKGRFGFNANGNTFFSWPNDGDYSFYREDFVGGQSRILSEDGVTETSRIGFFGTMGAFYDFNAYHSLTTSFRIRGFSFDRDGVTDASFIDPLNAINQSYQRTSISDNLRSGYEWSLDYTIKFPGQKERELAFAYKLDGNVQDQKYIITQEDLVGEDPSLFRDERNDNDGNNRENILQADYVHPVSDNFKIEAGGKTTLRKVNSDYTYFNREGSEYVIDPSQTDFFDYQQDVMAGYFSSNVKMGEKYGLIAGIRYERTTIEGDLDNEGSSFANDYNNWLPSVIISRKFGKTSTLKLSYNRRIQRPSLRFINPYTQLDNNRNISVGNPELDPELNDQIELGYNTFIKKVSLNLAVFHRHTSDIIESILTVDEDGVSVTTFENVGENNSIGVNLFTSITFFEKWTIRGGINMYSYNATGTINGEMLSNDALLFSGNINSNLKLKNDWTIDMFGFFRGRRQTLQGFNPSFSIMGLGVNKKVWDDRGTLGIRVIEPFFENKQFKSELEGPTYIQTNSFSIPFRSIGLNLSYKFGKLDFKQRQRNTRIKNDDQKQGDDNQQF